MLGTSIAIAKRRVALFSAVLCLALCTQLSMAMLERLQHVFGIQHAPSMLAGEFDLGHKNHHSHESSSPHHQDGGFPDDSQPLAHHHHGGGVMIPWIASTSAEITMKPIPMLVYGQNVRAHPDAAAWRSERPPKSLLESLA